MPDKLSREEIAELLTGEKMGDKKDETMETWEEASNWPTPMILHFLWNRAIEQNEIIKALEANIDDLSAGQLVRATEPFNALREQVVRLATLVRRVVLGFDNVEGYDDAEFLNNLLQENNAWLDAQQQKGGDAQCDVKDSLAPPSNQCDNASTEWVDATPDVLWLGDTCPQCNTWDLHNCLVDGIEMVECCECGLVLGRTFSAGEQKEVSDVTHRDNTGRKVGSREDVQNEVVKEEIGNGTEVDSKEHSKEEMTHLREIATSILEIMDGSGASSDVIHRYRVDVLPLTTKMLRIYANDRKALVDKYENEVLGHKLQRQDFERVCKEKKALVDEMALVKRQANEHRAQRDELRERAEKAEGKANSRLQRNEILLRENIANTNRIKELEGLLKDSLRERCSSAPEDDEVRALCEKYGYGAVMSSASTLWRQKDPVGAITTGHCVGTLKAVLKDALSKEKGGE